MQQQHKLIRGAGSAASSCSLSSLAFLSDKKKVNAMDTLVTLETIQDSLSLQVLFWLILKGCHVRWLASKDELTLWVSGSQ